MTMANRKILTLFLFVFILTFLSGCGAKYIHKSFKSQEIDRITVLPFMDNRKNPDPELNFDKLAGFGRSPMIYSLKYDKKYRTVLSGDIGNVSSYSTQDLPSPDPNAVIPFTVDPESVDSGWIKQLGPSTEEWILVPVLEDLSTTCLLIQMVGRARISAYLFNKHTGELWWQCSSTAMFQAGILAYGLIKMTASEENYIEASLIPGACTECIKSLPVRTGPYLLPDKLN